MGDGLKRAGAAAARSRWDGTLTPQMRRFLNALPAGGRRVSTREIEILANRSQDRARQACRRLGLAVYGAGSDDRSGWSRTVHGDEAVAVPASPGAGE